jgi:LCP family protein required for cell wall assembly
VPREYADLLGRSGARRTRPSRWWQVPLLLLALIITIAVIYVTTSLSRAIGESYNPISDLVDPDVRAAPVQAGERVNILFMALDDEALRSDVMMLASIDTERKQVGVIQIPRDTRALLAGKGTIDKINAAYAFGVGDEEFPANLRALKTVEDLLDVRIHYTVVVDMDAFVQAIDAIGGVAVDIPIQMDYDDPYQDLHIHFEPGPHVLYGQKALEYVRWRHNNDGTGYPDEDLGRIRAQQEFIRSAIDQVTRPGTLISLPNLIAELSQYVESTIEPARLASLALLAASIDPDDVEMITLPGVAVTLPDMATGASASYYVHDPVETRRLVARLVYGVDPEQAGAIRVELVAPPGVEGVALLASHLEELGFDVSTQVTADADPPGKARVIPASPDREASLLVARALMAQGLEVEMVEKYDPNAGGVIRVLLPVSGDS